MLRTNVRKLFFVTSLLFLTSAVFFGGYYLGNYNSSSTSMILALDARLRSLHNLKTIKLLESGKLGEAKEIINLRLNGDILELDSLNETPRDQTTTVTNDMVLARIAEFRKRHPYVSPAGNEADERVQAILSEALAKYPIQNSTLLSPADPAGCT